MANRTVSYQDRTTDDDTVVVNSSGRTPAPNNNMSPLIWLAAVGVAILFIFWLSGGFGQTTTENVEANPTNMPNPTNVPNPTNIPNPTNVPNPTNMPNPTNVPNPTNIPNPTPTPVL